MDYKVEKRHLARTDVLFVHHEVPVEQIGAVLGPSFAAVWTYAEQHGVEPSGVPYARFHTSPPTMVLDAGVPIPKALAGEGDVRSGELPECDAAVTTHIGPYEEMQPAYEAIEAWMKENGRSPGGAPWEVYFSDPAQEPDPKNWRTEIVWPLA